MSACATCESRPRISWKMLILGCYWVCLCHIIAGESTLHDIISAAADTTGGNNNNNNTNKKQTVSGDDDMPFHWPPTLLNQQHRSFSSFSGQGVQIHTSKRKPDDPDFGVLVRILRSATREKDTELISAAASAKDSNVNNNNGNLRVVSPSSSTGRRRRRALKKRETRRRRRNIISGDDENNGHNGRGLLENSAINQGPLDQRQTMLLLRKPRSAAVFTQDSDKIPLLALDANTNKRPSTLDQSASSSSATIPLQYIIVVILGVPVAELNRSSLQVLRVAFSQALKIPLSNTGIDKIRLKGNSVEMFFTKPGRSSAPFKLGDFLKASTILASNNLLSNVQTQIPQLQIESLQPAIYCCYRQKVKKAELENPTVQRIFYPTLKPNMKDAMMVQPESSPVYVVKRCVTPLPAQTPVQTRSEGLLKRRGSSASLTLDLNPSPELPRWEGTPPKESSGLEYLMSAGNRLSRRDLRNAVKNVTSIYEEFWEIPTNHPEKVYVAGSGTKNRYKTMIPNEHSRVILPNYEGDPLSSYINANYIRGYEVEACAYIATQGPMAHTIVDFWRMIWHEKSPIIVMITKLKEKNQSKCENYLPEKMGAYGDIEVTVDKVAQRPGYLMHFLTLRSKGESHKVVHYWYTAWPDHKPPDSPKMILDLVREVELRRYKDDGITPKGPVTVHCSAGIGRTGCFIAISIGIRQLREEHSVDVLGIVCSMRMDRGGMIQTHEQYEFIHQALCEYEKMLDAGGD